MQFSLMRMDTESQRMDLTLRDIKQSQCQGSGRSEDAASLERQVLELLLWKLDSMFLRCLACSSDLSSCQAVHEVSFQNPRDLLEFSHQQQKKVRCKS